MRELLLVDDNATLLRVMGRSLASYYKVTTFTHPRDAITYMESSIDKLDVIISDFKMPGINGLELLEQATAIKKSTIRVLLTGYADDEVFENRSDTCDAIIDKNICKNIQDIVSLVDKLTAQKAKVNSQ